MGGGRFSKNSWRSMQSRHMLVEKDIYSQGLAFQGGADFLFFSKFTLKGLTDIENSGRMCILGLGLHYIL